MNAQKVYLLSLLLIIVSFINCTAQVIVKEYSVKHKGNQFTIGETTLDQVINVYGQEHTTKIWSGYSIEYFYADEGISFSHKLNDSTKTVLWISVNIDKNTIRLDDKITLDSTSTVRDLIESLGRTTYEYDATYNGLAIDYETFEVIVRIRELDTQFLSSENFEDNWQLFSSHFKNHKIKGVEIY